MNPGIKRRSLLLAALLSGTTIYPDFSNETIVEFQTVMGSFEVNLYDNDTPATVENFLDYVNNGAFTNSVYHRSAPGFVVQGGGAPPPPAPASGGGGGSFGVFGLLALLFGYRFRRP